MFLNKNKGGFFDTILKIDIGDVSNIDSYLWSTASSKMSSALTLMSTIVVEEYIYIIGGWFEGLYFTTSMVQKFDPIEDKIQYFDILPNTLAGLAIAMVEQKIYIFGGLESFNGPPTEKAIKVDTWYYSNIMFSYSYIYLLVIYLWSWIMYFFLIFLALIFFV